MITSYKASWFENKTANEQVGLNILPKPKTYGHSHLLRKHNVDLKSAEKVHSTDLQYHSFWRRLFICHVNFVIRYDYVIVN